MGYPEIAKPQKAWKRERARIQTLLYKCVVAPNISDLKEEDFTLNTVGDDGKVTEMTIRRKMQENC